MSLDLIQIIGFYLDIDEFYDLKDILGLDIKFYLWNVKCPTKKEETYLTYKKDIKDYPEYDIDWACYAGYYEVVKFFDKLNYSYSSFAIDIACYYGDLKIIKYLHRKKYPFSINSVRWAKKKKIKRFLKHKRIYSSTPSISF